MSHDEERVRGARLEQQHNRAPCHGLHLDPGITQFRFAAAGRAGVEFDPNAISLWISDGTERYPLVRSGEIIADLKKAKEAMHGKKSYLYS